MTAIDKTPWFSTLVALPETIRAQKPLVHHITNHVVMNDTANITLAIGAAPVMAHALEEVVEMVSLASALVLNIGTLTSEQVESMLLAGQRANQLGIPIVLDPVGAGATRFRTESALRLLRALRIAVLRGNATEIGALLGSAGEDRAVEAITLSQDQEVVARLAAREFACCVAITGVRDVITDGERLARVDNGHALLATITGSGCLATSMIAAFLTVEHDAWLACIAGLLAIDLGSELAAVRADGPGTFRACLIDAVARLDGTTFARHQKVSIP